MGQVHSSPITYSVQKNYDKQKPQTGIYRSIWQKQLIWQPHQGINNLQQLWIDTVKRNGQNKYLGTIHQIKKNGCLGDQTIQQIQYKTYKQIDADVKALGSTLVSMDLAPKSQGNIAPICLYSRNRQEWLVTDIACFYYGLTTVPFYDSLSLQSIPYILNQTGLITLLCGQAQCKRLVQVSDLGQLKNVILFEQNRNLQSQLKGKNINVYNYSKLIQQGKKNIKEPPKLQSDHPFTISYTSGTTGNPKGAILTHKSMLSTVASLRNVQNMQLTSEDRTLCYLPLPHIFQRGVSFMILDIGGHSVFSSGNKQKVLDQLLVVKPTIFVSVPRLYSRIYSKVLGQIQTSSNVKRSIADSAIESKQLNLKQNHQFTSTLYDALVFSKVQSKLGGKVRYALTASAPIQSKILNFLRIALACPVIQAYGQTQSMGSFFNTSVFQNSTGFVGGPNNSCQFKLVDIPQMDYHATDTLDGKRRPRGQICIRGPGLFNGYFKQPQLSKQALDSDGWLHTGDVGAVLPQNGALKIIDRKKNIFKLSQGEYVAPQKIENFYLSIPGVQQVWLHGDSHQSFCIAFFICDDESMKLLSLKVGQKSDNLQQLRQSKKFKYALLKLMNDIGKNTGKNSFQLAKNCKILKSSFATKNLLTDTFKIMRHKARQTFKQQIEALYKEGQLKL